VSSAAVRGPLVCDEHDILLADFGIARAVRDPYGWTPFRKRVAPCVEPIAR
jgi:hypothetical protein